MASSQSGAGSSPELRISAPHPVHLPHIESFDIAARYRSARCGGDFFDAVALDSRVLFLLTDIAGRQPETQALAVDVQDVFRTRAQELFQADANESEGIALLARDLNRSLIEAARGVRFAPAFIGCYNLALDILTYHYAGHFLAIFHDAAKARVLDPCGIPLGLFTHSTYEPAVLAFDRHAKLLLITKGSTEDRQGLSIVDNERIRNLLDDSATDAVSLCEAALQAIDEPESRARLRVRDLLHPRSQKDDDDLTAVALMRRDVLPAVAQTMARDQVQGQS